MGVPYTKPHLPVVGQLALLKQRGLVITDDAKCTDFLHRVGYYRLSGYWHPMRKTRVDPATGAISYLDDFRPDSQCAALIDLYVFDKKLRMLMLDAIERLEVGLRVEMALLVSQRDPWAHRKSAHVHPQFVRQLKRNHADWIKKMDEKEQGSREEFVEHFFKKYTSALPMWMAIELWDFGMLSTFLSGMKIADRTTLAAYFGLSRWELLTTWVRAINNTRNVCAHHGRLWNRALIERPSPPKVDEVPDLDSATFNNTRLYSVAVALRWFLKTLNPTTTWPQRLKDHFATFPTSPHYQVSQTGFPLGWEKLPFWD